MAVRTRSQASVLLYRECDTGKGTREIAEALAARLDVARIEGNPLIENHLPNASRRACVLRASRNNRAGHRLHTCA